jgi:predicted nucleic acid-binding protein
MIGRLELLRHYYGKIGVPNAVWDELKELGGTKAFELLQDALADGWIELLEVSNRPLAITLQTTLDRGEAEAIALASGTDADLLLMDEHDGRATAEHLGIRITGILGVLRRARLDGIIPSLKAEIDRLRAEAHFFISPRLEATLLESVGEGA